MRGTVLLTGKQAKYIDDYTQGCGVSGEILMDRAASFMAEYISAHYDKSKVIACIAGLGNNGGDVIVLADKLNKLGYEACVIRVTRDECPLDNSLKDYDIIVDGLFGIGLNRNIEGKFKRAVELINDARELGATVIACDIPSGINATTGLVMGCAVKADITITFAYEKYGHRLYPGKDYSGRTIVYDIGFDKKAFEEPEMQNIAFTNYHSLPARKNDSNKGTYGKVLAIAGSELMPGAAILASKAALRFGAGYSTLHSEQTVLDKVVVAVPEIVLSRAFAGEKYISPEYGKANAIIIGPGLGKSSLARAKVEDLLAKVKCEEVPAAFIIDADAINIISDIMTEENVMEPGRRASWLSEHFPKKTVFTPHKKELSRLLNIPMDELKSLASVLELFKETEQIFALKDAVTIVVSSKGVYINDSGNNGMSTPGVGDVLTGAIAAFIAQGMDVYEAACAGVYYHGLAGDLAKDSYSEFGVMAHDLCDFAALALKQALDEDRI